MSGEGGESFGGSTKQYPCLLGSIDAENGQVIVQHGSLLGVQGEQPEEAEINAHGIAAVPDLIDALVWIAKIADTNIEQDHKLRALGARTLTRIAERAEAALTKAGIKI